MLNQTLYSYTEHYPPEILLSLLMPFFITPNTEKEHWPSFDQIRIIHLEIYIQVILVFLHNVLDLFLNIEFE